MDSSNIAGSSRRQALALAFGLPGVLRAAVPVPPVRIAISESMVADVNLNDARAAMTLWLQRMIVEFNIVIEFSPKVFDTTEEIMHRARIGNFDCVALNVVEYRQIADLLDSSQLLIAAGLAGTDRYVLLAKRNSGIQRLADLKGRSLLMLKHPEMCVAGAWLSVILDEGRLSQSEQFFGSVTEDSKAQRVILPVFFGRTDACITNGRSFGAMCELNPQVAKELMVIAASPHMVAIFYLFRKGYRGAGRDAFVKVYSNLSTSASGRQLSTLFQFDGIVVKDAACLAPAMEILEKAARIARVPQAGSRK